MTPYFAVRLEDYFVPRGWFGWATYFTTMDDLLTLIAALKKFKRHPAEHGKIPRKPRSFHITSENFQNS